MAREAYLRDLDENFYKDNMITLNTKSEKFKNWWHYNKVFVFVGAAIIAIVVSQIYAVMTKVEPDYNIAIASELYMDSSFLDIMEEQLAAYGVDVNGDGEVIVSVQSYFLSTDSDYAEELTANVVKLSADITMGTSMIWLVDDLGYRYLIDGTSADLFLADAYDGEDTKVIDAMEISALSNMDVSAYEYYFDLEVDSDALIEAVYGNLEMVVRVIEGTSVEEEKDVAELYPYQVEFVQNLVSNTKAEVEETE